MRRVRYSDDAVARIAEIHGWLVDQASRKTADRIVVALIERCDSLAVFPHRGTPRPEVRPNLRTIPFRRRYVIGYRVDDGLVTILSIQGAGQDVDVLTGD